MSIEMGARGAIIEPDEVTYAYLENKECTPKGKDWDEAVKYWDSLKSDEDCMYDSEHSFNAKEIPVMITYGTNPGMAHNIYSSIDDNSNTAYKSALKYMGFKPGMTLAGIPIDYVFIGSCTNSRMEDLRDVANLVQGHRVAEHVTAWIVPGSTAILNEMKKEGIYDVLKSAGFEVREAGCSACLAMNEDKIPAGKLCLSTSNRNFEGRQGPGSKTILVSPITAAAGAIKGRIVHPDEMNNSYHGKIQRFNFFASSAMC
jgi:3-isopropylmalate/(R)-2-methylmalate dehydratase large subunit